MIHRAIYSASNGLLKRQFYFQNQMSFSSMSRRRSYIDLEEIPTLKQAYEERSFSPRNLKRAANLTRKYEHNEEFNKKISLIQADITKLRIDAIVNAANETLLGGGGVDGAIHSAAGPGLRKECWDLNGCDTGDAKITGGHDLPSKHVIHTVGPVGEKPGLLRSAYVRSMNVMCENNLKSIAFSNISTGVYGYPRGKAGQLALDTIRKWLEENSEYFDKLDRIIFCVFEDENKDVYETLLPLYFPPSVDIDNYVKEEEKPKTNEEKKGNEAGKDKDQEKTHTSLTTEQVNNKEIIGTDNDKGVKEKIEEKDHETLTTGKEPLSVDENKEVKKEKDHETSTTGQANDEGPLSTDKTKEAEEDKDQETSTTQINDKGLLSTDKTKEAEEDKDQETSTTGQVNDKELNTDKNEGKVKDKEVEEKDKTQDTHTSAASKDQDKDKTNSTDMVGTEVKDGTHDDDIDMPDAEQDNDVEMTDATVEPNSKKRPHGDTEQNDTSDTTNSTTKQDEDNTRDIEMTDVITEQNPKKRSHEGAETEQNSNTNERQTDMTNITTTGNTEQQDDEIMKGSDIDVAKTNDASGDKNQNENNTTDAAEMDDNVPSDNNQNENNTTDAAKTNDAPIDKNQNENNTTDAAKTNDALSDKNQNENNTTDAAKTNDAPGDKNQNENNTTDAPEMDDNVPSDNNQNEQQTKTDETTSKEENDLMDSPEAGKADNNTSLASNICLYI
ncbi:unnamed protein product [Rhizophagus irregularis]|nr:unnamed protein product [Rhizophagus irregularis]